MSETHEIYKRKHLRESLSCTCPCAVGARGNQLSLPALIPCGNKSDALRKHILFVAVGRRVNGGNETSEEVF